MIKKAMERPSGRHIPAKALSDLREILAHNDKVEHNRRVLAKDVLPLLQAAGVQCRTLTTLQAICREQLGRKSWAQK